MKRCVPLFALAGAALGLLGTAVTFAAAPSPSAPLQRQIDALLKSRQRPELLPVELPNPFVVTQGDLRETPDRVAWKVASPTDEEKATASPPAVTAASAADILANCVGRLKVGGLMRVKEEMRIVVNDTPRREGDYIACQWSGLTVPVRVVRIQPGLLTLRYEDAEMSIKY